MGLYGNLAEEFFVEKRLALQTRDERRELSRNSESLIYAIIIPRIVKLGTASTCRERQ